MFTLHYGLHGRQTPKGPSTPEDSADSLPPRLLQLLPVETKVTGRDSLPLKNSALARRTTIEHYLHRHADVLLTHGICPECFAKVMKDLPSQMAQLLNEET